MLLEHAAERREQIAIGELALVHVDARAEPRMRRIAALPAKQIAAGLFEHPPIERDDQSRFLGDAEKLRRQQQAALGMLPAHERLASLHQPLRRSTIG